MSLPRSGTALNPCRVGFCLSHFVPTVRVATAAWRPTLGPHAGDGQVVAAAFSTYGDLRNLYSLTAAAGRIKEPWLRSVSPSLASVPRHSGTHLVAVVHPHYLG